MAKILNKDPVTYQKERDGFLRELRQFHDSRGTPFRRVPKIHGHEVDLYLLYVLVTAHGGWEKVNIRSEWDSLSEQFSVPRHCVNGGIALKQIYIRFLERYEKVHFLGEDVDRDGDDDDGDSRQHRRWSARILHNVPLTYNYHQHQVSDQARQAMGLSTETYKSSEYDRLSLSLLSPMPNEQDFAINVCTLLSNEGKHTLRLEKCPRLVDFLLAHAGVFSQDSLREAFSDMYTHMRHHSVKRFWCDVVEDKDFRELQEPPRIKEIAPPTTPEHGPTSPPQCEPDNKKEPVCDPSSRLQESPTTSVSNNNLPAQTTSTDPVPECSSDVVPPPTTPPPPSTTATQNNNNNDTDCEMLDLSEPPVVVLNNERKSAEECELELNKVFMALSNVEEKPKIRMIDVSEEDMPKLPETESIESLFWPQPSKHDNNNVMDWSPEDQELFSLGRGLGTKDMLGQRVLQIATIMRNLSFEEDNIPVLGRNATFIRFCLLCMQSRYSSLSQLGMDMLGQIAGELVLDDPHSDTLAAMLVTTVTRGLSSPDRFVVLSSLEVLNKLCQNEENEEVMLKCLEQKVFDQVCSFLTLHDIMLLIYTLECLYSLSSLGERACNNIVRVHGAIDTLVSLITVEAQSYGPRACILMRVVERLPDQGAQSNTTSSGASGSSNVAAQNTPTMTTLTTAALTPIRQSSVITRNTITPHRPIVPQPAVSGGVPTLIQTPVQMQQQQHQHQQQLQENEQFALAWLRTTYELSSGHSVEQTELYRQYLASCAKIGRRGVIASLHFPRCVRSVFGGTVGPNGKQSSNPGSPMEYHYVGIKVRASAVPLLASAPASVVSVAVRKQTSAPTPPPAPSSPAPQPAPEPVPPATSPILKAQLSAPPKPREQATKPDATKSQVLAHPHLTQALLGSSSSCPQQQQSQVPPQPVTQQVIPARPTTPVSGASVTAPTNPVPSSSTSNPSSSSSSLIKSLLASKVNSVGESMGMSSIVTTTPTSDPQQLQVAQRQQQQRLLQQQLQSGTSTTSTQSSPPPLQPITPRLARPAILRPTLDTSKPRQIARINGARGPINTPVTSTQQAEPVRENNVDKKGEDAAENHIATSTPKAVRIETTQGNLLPPPPPKPRLDEDSDSAASTANSLVSSGGAASTDGENSLTSFEGVLLNGIPHATDTDAANDKSNEDSRSNDSTKESKTGVKMKGMLADLLEKKVVTKEPMINGVMGKEIRISDKGLEIVENHVDKVLKQESEGSSETTEQLKLGVKRTASVITEAQDAKKPLLTPPINGNAHSSETEEKSNNEVKTEPKVETPVLKQELTPQPMRQLIIAQPASSDASTSQGQQQLIMGPRQIIVAPGTLPQGQVVLSQAQLQANPQLKGQIIVQPVQGGPRQVLVQSSQMLVSSGQVVSQPMFVSAQSGTGNQFIVTQALQGSVVSASGQSYVIAQPQGLVQGQQPTVLVTQTPQQQGTNAKTIIILHQQAGGQKLMTQQGQQVMVQLPRSAVQGGNTTIQGMTLTQGAGGQVTVTLPGNMPVMARTVVTTSGANIVQQTLTRTLAPTIVTATKNVTTQAGVLAQVIKPVVATAVNAAQANSNKQQAVVMTATPPRPSTPRTLAGEATDNKTTNGPINANASTPRPPDTSPFLCEWRGCMRSFKSANEVYMHACRTHCPTGSEDVQCLWERCDGMKRKRFSLMTHLYDRHCNADVLRMMAVRRKQMAQSGRSEIPPPQPPPVHPGYAPDAALHAIKRHALEFVNPKELMQRSAAAAAAASTSAPTPPRAAPATVAPVPRPGPSPAEQNAEANAARRLSFQDDNEGPVTKSIRLTSSLILRNLVIYSNNGRRFLRSYEPHLASVALSNVESSRTIAQVLYDMSQGGEQS